MDIEEKLIILQSEDNTQFKIDLQLFQQYSRFISDTSQDLNLNEPIKCAMSTQTLEQIIQFVNDRKLNYTPSNIPKPLMSGNIFLYLNEIDTAFLKGIKTEKELYLILKAAEYFRMEGLQDLIFAYTAAQFIDKTNIELREKYGIQEQMNENIEKELKEKYGSYLQGTPLEE